MKRYYLQLQRAVLHGDTVGPEPNVTTAEVASSRLAISDGDVDLDEEDDGEEVKEHIRRFEHTLLDRSRLDMAARGEDGSSILYGSLYDEGGEDALPLLGGASGGLGAVENGREIEEDLLRVLEYEGPSGNDHDKEQHALDAYRAIAYSGVSVDGAMTILGMMYVDKHGNPCEDENVAKGLDDSSNKA